MLTTVAAGLSRGKALGKRTACTHAVFFGAGRYGLVVATFVAGLAFVAPHPRDVTITD